MAVQNGKDLLIKVDMVGDGLHHRGGFAGDADQL